MLDTVTYPTNEAYKFQYDENDRIKKIQFKSKSSGVFVDKYKYEYNSLGLLIRYTEVNDNGNTDYSFNYNNSGQLLSINKNGAELSKFLYDKYGNIQVNTLQFNNYTSTIRYNYDYVKGRLESIDYTNDSISFKKFIIMKIMD